jgi:agmatinase
MTQDDRYRPLDAQVIPRFAGIRTFMRLPHATGVDLDAAVVGIAFDTATSYRTGARFGPEAIRSASVLLRPFHPGFGIDVLDRLRVVDYGDVPVAPGDTEGTYRRIEEALAPLVDAGVFVLALGGDHSITLAELRAIRSRSCSSTRTPTPGSNTSTSAISTAPPSSVLPRRA